MARISLLCMLLLVPGISRADAVVATRTIQARSIIGSSDVAVVAADIPGAVTDAAAAIGREARVVLYAGRPIKPEHLGAPATVERNQIVVLQYVDPVIMIRVEGRALERGGVGDSVRVMNIGSRTTVTGTILSDGSVAVGIPQS